MTGFAANLTMLFGDAPFPDRFARARSTGFDAVEFLFPYAYPAAELAGLAEGLEIALFNLPPGNWEEGERGIAALPGREAEFRQAVGVALEYACMLGVKRLHAMAGLKTGGADRACYIGNLRFAAEKLLAHDIELLIEPISPAGISDYYLDSFAMARGIIGEVDAPNLRLQLDLFHAATMGEDACDLIERDFDRIGHVQIAGAPGRHEPDSGDVDHGLALKLLADRGYGGFVGCEYNPRGITEDGLGWREKFRP